MEMKRRIALVTAIAAVAIGSGHLVQSSADKRQVAVVEAENAKKPKAVVQLAAGAAAAPETPKASKADDGAVLAAKPAVPVTPPIAVATYADAPTYSPIVLASVLPQSPASAEKEPAALPPVIVAKPEPGIVAPAMKPLAEPAVEVADKCTISLDLMAEPLAMIGLSLVAPCHPNERIVMRHAGLAITGRTTATGSISTAMPALESAGTISVLFADGTKADATIDMPEVTALTRFVVQWQADDAFQVHAFENGAEYGQPGHVSAADTQAPNPIAPSRGGFLLVLGDSTVDLPLLAEVYTYPKNTTVTPEVLVEAAVTATTCGRDLLGETLVSTEGSVIATDLMVAMPDCTAIGDFLVLKNVVPGMTLAAID